MPLRPQTRPFTHFLQSLAIRFDHGDHPLTVRADSEIDAPILQKLHSIWFTAAERYQASKQGNDLSLIGVLVPLAWTQLKSSQIVLPSLDGQMSHSRFGGEEN
jgi:hypothetical protein